MATSLKEAVRLCDYCGQQRSLADFAKWNRKCYPCRYKQNKDIAARRRKLRLISGTRFCPECNEQKPVKDFHQWNGARRVYRLSKYCAPCMPIVRRRYGAEWTQKRRESKAGREHQRAIQRSYYDRNRAALQAATRASARSLKLEFISHYGGKCACCGEAETDFLTLDHVKNDGKYDRARKSKGGGGTQNDPIMRALRRAGWPAQAEYQVLCFNCNCAKGYFGMCPHQRKTESANIA